MVPKTGRGVRCQFRKLTSCARCWAKVEEQRRIENRVRSRRLDARARNRNEVPGTPGKITGPAALQILLVLPPNPISQIVMAGKTIELRKLGPGLALDRIGP